MPTPPIIIIGAGISGLVLAQGLKRHSIPFRIYERDESLTARSQGYRFRISDEAIDALEQCLSAEHFQLVKRTSAYVKPGSSNIPPRQLDAPTGEPKAPPPMLSNGNAVKPSSHGATKRTPLSVDRMTLKRVLLRGLESDVEYGKVFERFDEIAEGVLVRFADGSTAVGRLVVGADGARSRVRRQLLPEHRLLDTGGRVIFGKTGLTESLALGLNLYMKEGLTAFQDPENHLLGLTELMVFSKQQQEGEEEDDIVPEDHIYWLVYVPRSLLPAQTILSSDEALALARTATAHWTPGWRTILDNTHHAQASLYQVITMHPDNLPSYDPKTSVLLIGDAMHAMSTTGVLGATVSIRDSGELLDALLAFRDGEGGIDGVAARARYEEKMEVYAADALRKSQVGGKMIFGMGEFDELEAVA